jgi:hypothetical protein
VDWGRNFCRCLAGHGVEGESAVKAFVRARAELLMGQVEVADGLVWPI